MSEKSEYNRGAKSAKKYFDLLNFALGKGKLF